MVCCRPPVLRGRGMRWLRRSWKATAYTASYVALMFFAALPLVSQFSAAEPPVKRWFSHPLVQLPHFHHIPKPLRQASKSVFANEEDGFVLWLEEQE